MAATPRWSISGEYFEHCNCDVVCPCEVSPQGVLKARPDRETCEGILVFHVDAGQFVDTDLAGFNVVLAVQSPGVMADGNWTAAPYLDARAAPQQREALAAIFCGAADGPLAALAPLIGEHLPPRFALITWERQGNRRRVTIPDVLDATIEAVPGADGGELVKKTLIRCFRRRCRLTRSALGTMIIDSTGTTAGAMATTPPFDGRAHEHCRDRPRPEASRVIIIGAQLVGVVVISWLSL